MVFLCKVTAVAVISNANRVTAITYLSLWFLASSGYAETSSIPRLEEANASKIVCCRILFGGERLIIYKSNSLVEMWSLSEQRQIWQNSAKGSWPDALYPEYVFDDELIKLWNDKAYLTVFSPGSISTFDVSTGKKVDERVRSRTEILGLVNKLGASRTGASGHFLWQSDQQTAEVVCLRQPFSSVSLNGKGRFLSDGRSFVMENANKFRLHRTEDNIEITGAMSLMPIEVSNDQRLLLAADADNKAIYFRDNMKLGVRLHVGDLAKPRPKPSKISLVDTISRSVISEWTGRAAWFAGNAVAYVIDAEGYVYQANTATKKVNKIGMVGFIDSDCCIVIARNGKSAYRVMSPHGTANVVTFDSGKMVIGENIVAGGKRGEMCQSHSCRILDHNSMMIAEFSTAIGSTARVINLANGEIIADLGPPSTNARIWSADFNDIKAVLALSLGDKVVIYYKDTGKRFSIE